jgi:hypothetical protein
MFDYEVKRSGIAHKTKALSLSLSAFPRILSFSSASRKMIKVGAPTI